MKESTQHPTTLLIPCKSTALGLLFSVLLGPIGMLYATIWGAMVMAFLEVVVFKGTPQPLLHPGSLILLWFVGCMWSIMSINHYNKKILHTLIGQPYVTWVHSIKKIFRGMW